jgi:hypothetical protein
MLWKGRAAEAVKSASAALAYESERRAGRSNRLARKSHSPLQGASETISSPNTDNSAASFPFPLCFAPVNDAAWKY